MTDITPAIASSEKGTIITLEVSAGSKITRFPAGYNEWRQTIGCMVHSPPNEGKANRDLIGILADFFKISKDKVIILSGTASPLKRVLLVGLPSETVLKALAPLVESS